MIFLVLQILMADCHTKSQQQLFFPLLLRLILMKTKMKVEGELSLEN